MSLLSYDRSMPIHLMKVAVGASNLDSIKAYQNTRLTDYNGRQVTWITTRNRPKQELDLLNGGSIYWILRNKFIGHQRIIGLESDINSEGKKFCRLFLDPELHATAPKPQQGFQGWRYLKAEDAPADLENGETITGFSEMPQEMIKDLQDMGLV